MDSNGCLSREEEAMLKTALAFVVIKSRYANNKKRALSQTDSNDGDATSHSSNYDALSSTPSTILNCLFNESPPRATATSRMYTPEGDHGSIITTTTTRAAAITPRMKFLHSTEDGDHSMHIFRVACSLAKTMLAKEKQRSNSNGEYQRRDGRASSSSSGRSSSRFLREDTVALAGTAGHLANQLSQLFQSSLAPPFPNANKRSRRSEHQPTQSADQLSPHDWIRTSLLESIEVDDPEKVRSSLKEDTAAMLAAFHVYHAMMPQLASRFPALVQTLFQVATELIGDLYHDTFVIRHRWQEEPVDYKRTLKHLAVSALRLLEACWMSQRPTSQETKKLQEEHLTLLLRDLPSLTVPIQSRDVPKLIYELATKKKLYKYKLRMEARVAAQDNTSVQGSSLLPSPPPPRNQSRQLPKYILDPIDKGMIRLAIYRLMMLR